MTLDILASLAVTILAAAEIASPSSLSVASVFIATSVLLLVVGCDQSYLILATLLIACCICFATVRKFRPSPKEGDSESSCSHGCYVIKQFVISILPTALASVFHVLAMWTLPFCILYSSIDAKSDPKFVAREVGHLLAGSFFMVSLVVVPILVLPDGQESTSVRNQLWESIIFGSSGLINSITFRISHHLAGNDPPTMSEFAWDHELLGVVVAVSNLVGVISSLQNIRTSIHVVFPTAFVALDMQSHTNTQHMDTSDMYGWKLSWMKLHMLYGILFLGGALCRLIGRKPESIFFFYIGSFTFVMSSRWLVMEMHDALSNPDDPESATDQVLCMLVATLATVSYAMFLGTAMRLRKLLNNNNHVDSDAAAVGRYEALATNVPGSEDEVAYLCNESEKENGSVNGNDRV